MFFFSRYALIFPLVNFAEGWYKVRQQRQKQESNFSMRLFKSRFVKSVTLKRQILHVSDTMLTSHLTLS